MITLNVPILFKEILCVLMQSLPQYQNLNSDECWNKYQQALVEDKPNAWGMMAVVAKMLHKLERT